jgi:parallel beta-helix repeat protein
MALAVTAVPTTLVVNRLLKEVVHRQPPDSPLLLFPSGHLAMAAAAVLTAVLVVRVAAAPSGARRAVAWLAGGFLAALAAARQAGTHLRNFSVRPKSGDRFCGEPGAVLDGGRSLQRAFSGSATNVTLDSITVRDYAPGWQGGAIQPDRHASGWLLRNISSLHNGWAGLLLADGMRILGGHFNDNDQLGIGGNEATGIVLDGLDDDPATFDGPELARNHHLHASCDWESAGMKWDFGQVTIRNAYVHDNDCKGLWAGINVHDTLIEHNLIRGNRDEGIFYEISREAVIRNNRVYGNGLGGSGWYWAGGITVASSSDVEVYGNRLSGNFNGSPGPSRTGPTPPRPSICSTTIGSTTTWSARRPALTRPGWWPTTARTCPPARSRSPATLSSRRGATREDRPALPSRSRCPAATRPNWALGGPWPWFWRGRTWPARLPV